MGATCALTLAVLVGVCSADAGARVSTEPRGPSVAQGSQRKSSVSADLPGSQERLVGVHDPSVHGRLELSRTPHKPTPHPKRADPRLELAVRQEARLATLTRTLLSCTWSVSQGRIADRPVVANCPAQGPPRTA
ncbi:hypothetical protein JRI60_41735 [Archangium violaceum]|uniref:hypothetical protein n=1 Tax=Archangium violaceum TaxID=83451 RepID=UPI00194F6D29|nr:hypothetical protein [Archangium violaceum]QRN95520.1 hypothetical protein JRI60_41735 [Archangium violaceum]